MFWSLVVGQTIKTPEKVLIPCRHTNMYSRPGTQHCTRHLDPDDLKNPPAFIFLRFFLSPLLFPQHQTKAQLRRKLASPQRRWWGRPSASFIKIKMFPVYNVRKQQTLVLWPNLSIALPKVNSWWSRRSSDQLVDRDHFACLLGSDYSSTCGPTPSGTFGMTRITLTGRRCLEANQFWRRVVGWRCCVLLLITP
jgi:hypothetical protein